MTHTIDYNSYDGTGVLNSLFHLRFVTRDKWSRDVSNPVEQAFSVVIDYQCSEDYFKLKTGMKSIGQQEYELKILQSTSRQLLSLDWSTVIEQVITPCAYTHPTYVFNNNTREWDPFTASPLYSDFDILDSPTDYFLSF